MCRQWFPIVMVVFFLGLTGCKAKSSLEENSQAKLLNSITANSSEALDILSQNSGECPLYSYGDEYDIDTEYSSLTGSRLTVKNGMDFHNFAVLAEDIPTGQISNVNFEVSVVVTRYLKQIGSFTPGLGSFKNVTDCGGGQTMQISGQQREVVLQLFSPFDPTTILYEKAVNLVGGRVKIKISAAEIESISESGNLAAGVTGEIKVNSTGGLVLSQVDATTLGFKAGDGEIESAVFPCLWAVFEVNPVYSFDMSKDRTQTNAVRNGGGNIIYGSAHKAMVGNFRPAIMTTALSCEIGVVTLDQDSAVHSYIAPQAVPPAYQQPLGGSQFAPPLAPDNTIPMMYDIERKDFAVTNSWRNPLTGPGQSNAVDLSLGSIYGFQSPPATSMCGPNCDQPCTRDIEDVAMANSLATDDNFALEMTDEAAHCQAPDYWWPYKSKYLVTRVKDSANLAYETSRDIIVTELGEQDFDSFGNDVYDIIVANGLTANPVFQSLCNFGLTLFDNDGQGNLTNKTEFNLLDSSGSPLPADPLCALYAPGQFSAANMYHTAVLHLDFDGDGDLDLYVDGGGSLDPNNYTSTAQAYFFENVGDGNFGPADGVDDLVMQTSATAFIPEIINGPTKNTLRVKAVLETHPSSIYDMYLYRFNEDGFEVWGRQAATFAWFNLTSAVNPSVNRSYANTAITDANWDGILDIAGITGEDPSITSEPNTILKGDLFPYSMDQYPYLPQLQPETVNAFRDGTWDVVVPFYTPAIKMDLDGDGVVNDGVSYTCNPWDPANPYWDLALYPDGAFKECNQTHGNKAHGYFGYITLGSSPINTGYVYGSGDRHNRALFLREPVSGP